LYDALIPNYGQFNLLILLYNLYINQIAAKTQNTVFGYKKWSNSESDGWNRSATSNMWWVSFVKFLVR